MVGVREEVAVLPQADDPNVTGTGQVLASTLYGFGYSPITRCMTYSFLLPRPQVRGEATAAPDSDGEKNKSGSTPTTNSKPSVAEEPTSSTGEESEVRR